MGARAYFDRSPHILSSPSASICPTSLEQDYHAQTIRCKDLRGFCRRPINTLNVLFRSAVKVGACVSNAVENAEYWA